MRQSKADKSKPTLDLSQLLSEFEGIKRIYEVRGLVSTTFKDDADFIEKNQLTFKFSLYQIPALLLDYFFRKQVNSLEKFLTVIPVGQK